MNFLKPARSRLSIIQKRPVGEATIVALDIEATGLDENAEIIQMAALGTGKFNFFFDEYYSAEKGLGAQALAVNQITQEMIEGKPLFNQGKALILLQKLNTPDNIFVAHNAKYDLRMLEQSGVKINMQIVDTMQAALHLYPDALGVGLSSLFLNEGMYRDMDALEEELFNDHGVVLDDIGPHNALYDIVLLQVLLNNLLKRVDGDIKQLVELSDKPVLLKKPLNFGKYKGSTVSEIAKIDRNYLTWCVKNMEGLDENWKYTMNHYINGGTGKVRNSAEVEKSPALAETRAPQIQSTLEESPTHNTGSRGPVVDMSKL